MPLRRTKNILVDLAKAMKELPIVKLGLPNLIVDPSKVRSKFI